MWQHCAYRWNSRGLERVKFVVHLLSERLQIAARVLLVTHPATTTITTTASSDVTSAQPHTPLDDLGDLLLPLRHRLTLIIRVAHLLGEALSLHFLQTQLLLTLKYSDQVTISKIKSNAIMLNV